MSLRGRLFLASLLLLIVAAMCASPEAERLLAGFRAAQAALALTFIAFVVISCAKAELARNVSMRQLAAGTQPCVRLRQPRGGYVPLLC